MKKSRILLICLCVLGLTFVSCNNNKKTDKVEPIEETTTETETTPVEEEKPQLQVTGISMQMVVNETGGIVGRYESTNDDGTYTIVVQDYSEVPIEGHHVVVFTPENGQGIVYSYEDVDVYQKPNANSDVIGHIKAEEGYLPETFSCLGVENCWYKIDFAGTEGYVRLDLMKWDGMDMF